ncbi:TonB-dependent receptor [Sphingopyxis terrae]|uniref:Iron complex outermembrane recepter protein n=1 Tax=Sphingopyxis terrae subsp. ummariensis TaxID=429001 RepID=A0A1Y6FUA2_9SPHN|nr:TonB-dependent receptor [Sphingopyxis terrae]PCF90945.1 TonB-dependent receptor [Sphingopyxis terrae subsp. ummariensis]SMQ76442.1 iron complex outermembrane recepter protein [Sphingopyxis terrae subsp. ummariensis]
MSGNKAHGLSFGAYLVASASLFFAIPAWAQSAEQGQDAAGDVDDSAMIVVTAQKREQDIQDVPISMTVVGGEQLTDLGIQDFTELDRYVPNFYVQTTPGNNAFYIRGIGSTPGNLAFEQTVGLFVDGIYGGHARQFQAPFLDVERIEVLRGPQGALVGKNTSAGAISVVSARPTRDFRVTFEGSYEFELGGTRLFGMVSGPLSDAVSVRVAGQYEDSDGYIENTQLGGNETKRKSLFGRASVLIDPGNGADLLIRVEGGKVDLTGTAVERFLSVDDPDRKRATGGFPGFMDKDFDNTDNFNASATANIEIGDHVLTSVTGFSSYDFEKKVDADFGPNPAFASRFAEKFSQMSQEIRLASPTTGRLEYILGGYFHVNDYDLFQSTLIRFGPFNGRADRAFRQENVALSGFGSATWHLADALRLVGSLRYTYDRKIADQTRINSGVVQPTWLATPLSGRRVEREWDPSVAIQWDAGRDAMLYASYGQGSKAGGFIGAQSTTTQAQFEIEAEAAETFEIGAKLALFDRQLRFNIAGFRTDFTNLQVSSFDAVSNSFITTNAGKARSQGVEADLIWQVADGISLNGSLAYLDAKFIDFPGAPCPFTNPTCVPATNNAAGQPLPRSPKWSGTLFADVAIPLSGSVDFIANGGVTYRSSAFLEESFNPAAAQDSFAKFDLRLGARGENKRWEIAVVGKNLTDELTASHAFNTPLAAGVISKFLQPPRTIALQAKFQY